MELPDSTRTAQDAARAIGCTVAQIAKSLIFRGEQSGDPILVIASGANRVDTAKLARYAGEPVRRADADFVRERTGFAIGGVPPVGHTEPVTTFIDEELLQYEVVWAAAGTPHAVFRLRSSELQQLTGGQIRDVKQ
ncbi:MAG: prolyl-tRNA editing protein [Rhodothermaceae bacterium]|nr:MAG: prolyl-tRNA editing protein [Rhodothermaceae bacterium]